MKSFLLSFFALALTVSSYGQVISYDDFRLVIPYIQKEDYKGAFEQTGKLLKSRQNDSSDLHGIVIYMNIYAAAGMVSLDQMSQADFLKHVKGYVGQRLVMPAHRCVDSSTKGYNALQFVPRDGQMQGLTISANRLATNILCFEYFNFADPIDPITLIGKTIRCGGNLTKVEGNPNGSKVWICRLHIANAFARDIMQQ